jgi:hypothetical protein
MTRSNVNKRLAIAVARAAGVYPNLARRRISPHSVRHYADSRIMPNDKWKLGDSAVLKASASA